MNTVNFIPITMEFSWILISLPFRPISLSFFSPLKDLLNFQELLMLQHYHRIINLSMRLMNWTKVSYRRIFVINCYHCLFWWKKLQKCKASRKRIRFPQEVIMWMHWEIRVPLSCENLFKFKKKNNRKIRPKLTAHNPHR